MARSFEVWDTLTANQIGIFSSQAEAEALLHDVLRVNGANVVKDMVVLRSESDAPDAELSPVLEGADFLAWCEMVA